MTQTIDQSADIAREFYAKYQEAARLSDGDLARIRMQAIIGAAKDANVWRHFCALRDGHVA